MSLIRYLSILWQIIASPLRDGRSLAGTLLLLLMFPVFLVVQLLHWLGFVADEIFFRGYRRVEVVTPVFILGPPRSGTTHLHRVLAQDDGSTTFRTWECLFGLSVTGRKLWLGLAAFDRLLGRPVARFAAWVGHRLAGEMNAIHPFGLDEPEEDFLCLMPAAACFLLTVPLPRAAWLWRFARFDTDLGSAEKRRYLRYYRTCIQKHLYVFGCDKRFLSKNASFSGMAESLLNEFPDCRILYTNRDPVETVPSQLSAIRPALRACGFLDYPESLQSRLVELLRYYYENLHRVAARYPGRMAMLYNTQLREQLADSVCSALSAVGIDTDPALIRKLQLDSRASRQHRSTHHYTLEEFGLTAGSIESQFAEVYDHYDFATASPRATGAA